MHDSKPLLRLIIILIFIYKCFCCNAQINLPLSSDYSFALEAYLIKDPGQHVTIKPLDISINSRLHLTDSIYGVNTDIKTSNGSHSQIRINPILQSSYLFQNRLNQHQAVGLQTEGTFGKKISFFIYYAANILSQKPFENTRLDSANLIDHWGKAHKTGSFYFFNQFTGGICFTANRFLGFQVGQDKHFFGDGYRSLFLSDNAPPYPFFSTSLKIWNVKYVNQVMLLEDYLIGKKYTSRTRKYAAMHILSWNTTKNINISVFEAVVWQSKDSTGGLRSLDIHYLNPFTVFRPIEYNLGSPDNMLIGIGSRIRILKETYGYAQLLFDEFYLKEILARSGGWANKYAMQLGMKSFRFLNIDHLYFQVETNFSRPFTYGHTYPLQNYGYLFQPLAHPQGSNFRETLLRLGFQKNSWIFHYTVTGMDYGIEPGGASIGSDIYISSNNRLVRNKLDNGNYIGQGIHATDIHQEFKIARVLNARWGLIAEAGIQSITTIKPAAGNDFALTFGLKTWFYKDEKLF